MQYLLQNKVNYLTSSSKAISFANNGVTTSNSAGALQYLNGNVYYNHALFQRVNMYTQQNRTAFNIAAVNGTYFANVVIINFKPSFTCSNIIAMTNTDSVTYTVDITKKDSTHVTKEYTFPLKKQFMNTLILTDVLTLQSEITRINITAKSTLPLTLLRSYEFKPYGQNGEILIK